MLTADYEGAVCEIKTVDGDLIVAGRVDTVSEGGIEITDPFGPLPILPYRMQVKVSLLSGTGSFRLLTGQVYISAPERLQIMQLIDFVEYERRRFFRLDVDLRADILSTPPPTATGKPPSRRVRIRNLSLCGALFVSESKYLAGERVRMLVPLVDGIGEALDLVIMRVEDMEDGRYSYGAELVELDDRMEQILCAYLFEQQRLQIRHKRDITHL